MKTREMCLMLATFCFWSIFSLAAEIPKVDARSEPITLREWLVIGPFIEAEGIDPWDKNYLGKTPSESEVGLEEYNGFAQSLADPNLDGQVERPAAFRISTQRDVDLIDLFRHSYVTSRPTAAYAACEVSSESERNLTLLVGTADESKVWLNGQLISNTRGRRGLYTYSEAIPVTLRAGRNYLLLKIIRWRGAFGLGVRLEPSVESATQTALDGQGMLHALLLNESLLAAGDPLEFAPRGVPLGASLPAEITSPAGQLLLNTTLVVGSGAFRPELPQGIYELHVLSGAKQYIQPFVVGDQAAVALELTNRTRRIVGTPELQMAHLNALQSRIDIINRRPTRDSRTLAYTLLEWDVALTKLEANREAFRDAPGLHLRAFRSAIDGQTQYYRIFVPSSYNRSQGSVPLVVVEPTVISASRPFIESPFLASHSEAERMSAIAERLGIALVWCGYRNKPAGLPYENAHLDEVLKAVEADYAIDRHKISLLGVCSGAAISMMNAAHWPGRFAAAGFLNPVLGLRKEIPAENARLFLRVPGFRQWYHADYVHPYFTSPIPTLVVHDGAEVGHGSLEESKYLVQEAQKAGAKVEFQRMDQSAAQHFAAFEELLKWLSRQRRDECSVEPFASALPMGSIDDALARPFIVIVGTKGDDADKMQVRRLSETFQASWKKTHFAPCRMITDVEYDLSETNNSTLVLIGNQATNSIWQKWSAELPVVCNGRELKYMEHSWKGSGLSIQAVVAHPENSKRRIVLLGAHDLTRARFESINLPSEGWFSFAVWNFDASEKKLIAAELR